MTTCEETSKKPLWLLIEENLLGLQSQDLVGDSLEASIQRVAGELDKTGHNVSRHGGNLMQLRWAVDKMVSAGTPLLKDLNTALGAFKLEDVADPFQATTRMLDDLEKTWPELKMPDRRADVVQMVEKTKLELLIAKAKGLSGDEGMRLLIGENVDDSTIIEGMGVSEDELKAVHEAIKKELAERERVAGLLEKVKDKSKEEQVKHLFEQEVSEALIIEMAQVDQGVIEAVQKAMEEELKEKQRLAEEEAARKKAEAEGPSLDDISSDDMIYYIDSVREIMEFSDVEKEIRTMCEQSAIPKAIVDIAVSDPAKLDELEKNAGG
ncbi:MAG: hypothetical protein CR984_06680 [Proteobacteria bacterium]|nr:MAG: hypothetical protein CR984_06680 [Pseudomonadota bacterium]